MATVTELNLDKYCAEVAARAKRASMELATVSRTTKDEWLRRSAQLLRENEERITEANERDLAAAPGYGLTDAAIDRLRLNRKRIDEIAVGLEQIAELADPIGELIRTTNRPNGLRIDKVRVPLGVVFFIYESRPNVTADAAAICVKTGNAVILRGGKEAIHSSQAIVELLGEAAEEVGLPADAVQLVSTTDRAAVGKFLAMPQYIDVAIPRGGEGLIRRVAEEAKMPVIKHFTGNCHVYVDAAADLEMAEKSSSTASASGWACATRPSRSWCTPTWRASFCPRSAANWRSAASKFAATNARASWCRTPSRQPTKITRPSFWAR